jgi:hypothetical protein
VSDKLGKVEHLSAPTGHIPSAFCRPTGLNNHIILYYSVISKYPTWKTIEFELKHTSICYFLISTILFIFLFMIYLTTLLLLKALLKEPRILGWRMDDKFENMIQKMIVT